MGGRGAGCVLDGSVWWGRAGGGGGCGRWVRCQILFRVEGIWKPLSVMKGPDLAGLPKFLGGRFTWEFRALPICVTTSFHLGRRRVAAPAGLVMM